MRLYLDGVDTKHHALSPIAQTSTVYFPPYQYSLGNAKEGQPIWHPRFKSTDARPRNSETLILWNAAYESVEQQACIRTSPS